MCIWLVYVYILPCSVLREGMEAVKLQQQQPYPAHGSWFPHVIFQQKNQFSLEKCLISVLGQGKSKVSPRHLWCQNERKCIF